MNARAGRAFLVVKQPRGRGRLWLSVIAAPMFLISGVDLVVAPASLRRRSPSAELKQMVVGCSATDVIIRIVSGIHGNCPRSEPVTGSTLTIILEGRTPRATSAPGVTALKARL
jgi:hypothetical protein